MKRKVEGLNLFGNRLSGIQKDRYVLNKAIYTYSKKLNKDI